MKKGNSKLLIRNLREMEENKQCTLYDVVHSTLEMKIKAHESVCAWFEIDHDKYTYKHNVDEMTKNKIELNAQIKMLRHLLSTQ